MSVLDVRCIGDPILRKKARPVRAGDPNLPRLVRDMIDTLHAENGVGLAAPQVGISVSLLIFDLSTNEARIDPVALINPRLVEACTPELQDFDEGCLSIPGIRHIVKRPACITVEALNIQGKRVLIEKADGLLARVLQHEMDHLNGVLFLDRLDEAERAKLAGEVKRLERETRRSLKK